jgi:hypothetical protein
LSGTIPPPGGALQVFEPQVTGCPDVAVPEASANVTTGRFDPSFGTDASTGLASMVELASEPLGVDSFELLQAETASHAGTSTALRIRLRISMFRSSQSCLFSKTIGSAKSFPSRDHSISRWREH